MIYKRGGYYWYEFEFHGKRQRGTTKVPIGRGVPGEVTPKEKAKQVEAAKRIELALSNAGIKKRKPAPVFSKFADRFEKWVAVDRKEKPRTVEFYTERIRQLKKFDKLAKASLDDIDERLIADYIQWRSSQSRVYALRKKDGIELADSKKPISVSSLNRDLAVLRRILNVARLWKVIPSVPIIKLLPGEKHHERVLSHKEEDVYLSKAPAMLREFATVMLDTGMRPEEICRLRWENIHLNPIKGSHFGYFTIPRARRSGPSAICP